MRRFSPSRQGKVEMMQYPWRQARISGVVALLLMASAVCLGQDDSSEEDISLVEARQSVKSELRPVESDRRPAKKAPADVFLNIKYRADVGELAAYLSPDPEDGKQHPAIIWITGGDCNSIGNVWSPKDRDNDQSAAAYREVGIIMMYPSLRGGNDNPGVKEGFLGEVDDVLAAADYLAKVEYVDPNRIYLGGHSTGGTLVLLVAECSSRFRGVISFGPVGDVRSYSQSPEFLPFDYTNEIETAIRSPKYWLSLIESPTWVIEGSRRGNADSLREMAGMTNNANVRFIEIEGADHFNLLAPLNELLAKRILKTTGKPSALFLTEAEANSHFEQSEEQ